MTAEKNTQEAPQAPAPKVPKAPKPIAFEAQGEIKAAKQGSKLSRLIDALAQGATIDQLVQVLSQSGSAVDAAGVRSWISYDLRRVGLGCRQDGERLFLVGTPLPHRVAEPKKTPEAPVLKVVSEPKQKKAAMRPPKKAKKSKEASAK